MSAEMPEEFELRWTKGGDRLFVSSTWAYDAHIVSDTAERFYRLPMGYKRAADILVEQANSSVVDRPNLIYPVLFCYRQSIELFLKKIIDKFGKEKDFSPKHTHELGLLWKHFMCIANERGSSDADGIDVAQRLVTEMNEADQKSDGFRFPTDKKDAPFIFGDRGIDLDNLHEVMSGLVNFFECVYLQFSHHDEIVAQTT
jgi:hypothetical protein